MCRNLEICLSQLGNMLMHCVPLACACNCINSGWLCSGISVSVTAAVLNVCDCACLIIHQNPRSVCWVMNAGQARGGSALRWLCREWLSWKNFKESGVLSDFHSFLISAFPFWIPLSACLLRLCMLFYRLTVTFHLSAFIVSCLSIPFFFISLSHSHPFLLSVLSHISRDNWFLIMQGFHADSVLSEGWRDDIAKYPR